MTLFAIAAVTCLLFDGDPTTVVFDQKELRLHFRDSTISYSEVSTASRKNQQSATLSGTYFVHVDCQIPPEMKWYHVMTVKNSFLHTVFELD